MKNSDDIINKIISTVKSALEKDPAFKEKKIIVEFSDNPGYEIPFIKDKNCIYCEIRKGYGNLRQYNIYTYAQEGILAACSYIEQEFLSIGMLASSVRLNVKDNNMMLTTVQ